MKLETFLSLLGRVVTIPGTSRKIIRWDDGCVSAGASLRKIIPQAFAVVEYTRREMPDSTQIARRLYESLANMPCEECEHKLKYHIDKHGCEYERGDGYIGDAEYLQALGPCGCNERHWGPQTLEAITAIRDYRSKSKLHGTNQIDARTDGTGDDEQEEASRG